VDPPVDGTGVRGVVAEPTIGADLVAVRAMVAVGLLPDRERINALIPRMSRSTTNAAATIRAGTRKRRRSSPPNPPVSMFILHTSVRSRSPEHASP
jgi:hypothetical protein